jgi:hypothetical protein
MSISGDTTSGILPVTVVSGGGVGGGGPLGLDPEQPVIKIAAKRRADIEIMGNLAINIY